MNQDFRSVELDVSRIPQAISALCCFFDPFSWAAEKTAMLSPSAQGQAYASLVKYLLGLPEPPIVWKREMMLSPLFARLAAAICGDESLAESITDENYRDFLAVLTERFNKANSAEQARRTADDLQRQHEQLMKGGG